MFRRSDNDLSSWEQACKTLLSTGDRMTTAERAALTQIVYRVRQFSHALTVIEHAIPGGVSLVARALTRGHEEAEKLAGEDEPYTGNGSVADFITKLRKIVAEHSEKVARAVGERASVVAESETGDMTGAYQRNIDTRTREMRDAIVEAVVTFFSSEPS